jgi:hypothetical protein
VVPLLVAVLAALAAAHAAQQPAARRPPARTAGQAGGADTAADTVARPITYLREVYSYRGGPRDPFLPLLAAGAGAVGPEVGDLRVVGIAYDARGGNSVAVVRVKDSPRTHRLRRGDTIGRMRVLQIRQYSVVFQIEEFGFERQQELALQRPEAIQ